MRVRQQLVPFLVHRQQYRLVADALHVTVLQHTLPEVFDALSVARLAITWFIKKDEKKPRYIA